ncbi:MAG: hypothetical protein L6455_07265 [Kiritimatiellae bacterium]|nr:hypothetical protein [Verrucomicrobiota bacterium]MBU4290731.1 hypothetical protein [Verrucomicrobiota bacterium]MCG2679749.1 hypothetical protein [Kiritimatiellia bacterium]
MESKFTLKYMGKPIEASYERGKGFWIFTTDDKKIIVESSNLPISPPAGQLPVEIRPARYKRRFQSILIIRYLCYRNMAEETERETGREIRGDEDLARVRHQLNLKDADTLAAAAAFIKTLKRDSDGNIMPQSGEASIKRFVNGFQHEAVFHDGPAMLVKVNETTISNEQQNKPPTVNDLRVPISCRLRTANAY